MAKVIVTRSKLDALNAAVSAKCGTAAARTIDGMTAAVSSLPTGGGNEWQGSFITLAKTSVTVGQNSVTTTTGVRDHLLNLAGVDPNRLLGFSLRSKNSYSEGEIGRAIIYQNANINYFSVLQYSGGEWTTGRMQDNYSAVLVPGSVYDVFYWRV